jgi:hypothetical protein
MLLFLSYCANVLAAAPKTAVAFLKISSARALRPLCAHAIAPGVDMPLLSLGTCCGSDPNAGLQPRLDQRGVKKWFLTHYSPF